MKNQAKNPHQAKGTLQNLEADTEVVVNAFVEANTVVVTTPEQTMEVLKMKNQAGSP